MRHFYSSKNLHFLTSLNPDFLMAAMILKLFSYRRNQ